MLPRTRTIVIAALMVISMVLGGYEPVAGSALLQGTTYVVRKGDTLSGIASRYGTTAQAIMAGNGLSGSLIYPGQRLSIPGSSAASRDLTSGTVSATRSSVGSSTGGYYTIRAGDTLYGIAAQHGVSVSELMRANGLSSSAIYVGQSLVMPGSSGSNSSGGIGSASAPATSSTSRSTCGSTYTVRAGDTVSQIAARCGMSVSALVSASGLGGYRIWIGQSLSLGGAASTGTTGSFIMPPADGSHMGPTPTPAPAFPTITYP